MQSIFYDAYYKFIIRGVFFMEWKIKQISSLEKVRATDNLDYGEIQRERVLAGQRFSYQIGIKSDSIMLVTADVESQLAEYITLYQVKEVCMDRPVTEAVPAEEYITLEPGMMPDLLVPLHIMTVTPQAGSIWVRVDVPSTIAAGTYKIKIQLTAKGEGRTILGTCCKYLTLEVLSATMPEQKLIYTRWFYADCIAVAHDVEIYSEAHWNLIEQYIAAAADVGINMILVPIHTPPLNTEIGTARPCVQLLDIEKQGENYIFSFSKFKRFIDICKKHGIKYFEMAHMFTQWGAKCAPNIMVTENGKKDYMFGWHVAADSPEYTSFLKQYIQALSEELQAEGISEQTYFHISDEPTLDNIETYKRASDIIRPLIGNSKAFDALSNYVFYEKGLVECPVTCIDHVHNFLQHDIPNQWTYYCCEPQKGFPNSLLAMPSYNVRILGFLLYKYDIKGFLHWGFNYYNACRSLYPINPYQTTSADKRYPSGDSFIVYPGQDCVYPSIRGEITYEAIQDMNICLALEEKVGRERVVSMIDEAAGRDLRFDDYPRNNKFLENLRAKMVDEICNQ